MSGSQGNQAKFMYIMKSPGLLQHNVPSQQGYGGTSLFGTLWDLEFSPYYRGVLNSEVIQYTTVLHWDTEWCPYYRGFCYSEVL